jgi:flagellar assembly factor FliW
MSTTEAMKIRISNFPGFPQLNEFTIDRSDPSLPFGTLVSVEDSDISFLLGDPFVFYPDYEFDLPEELEAEWGAVAPTDLEVWGIITYKGSFPESTINLRAPLIINRKTMSGKQLILKDSIYEVRHPLVPTSDSGGSQDAGIKP